jgi:hypothetical protein
MVSHDRIFQNYTRSMVGDVLVSKCRITSSIDISKTGVHNMLYRYDARITTHALLKLILVHIFKLVLKLVRETHTDNLSPWKSIFILENMYKIILILNLKLRRVFIIHYITYISFIITVNIQYFQIPLMKTGRVDYIGKYVDGKTCRQRKFNMHSLVVQELNSTIRIYRC